jgi:hypothetical protein
MNRSKNWEGKRKQISAVSKCNCHLITLQIPSFDRALNFVPANIQTLGTCLLIFSETFPDDELMVKKFKLKRTVFV